MLAFPHRKGASNTCGSPSWQAWQAASLLRKVCISLAERCLNTAEEGCPECPILSCEQRLRAGEKRQADFRAHCIEILLADNTPSIPAWEAARNHSAADPPRPPYRLCRPERARR